MLTLQVVAVYRANESSGDMSLVLFDRHLPLLHCKIQLQKMFFFLVFHIRGLLCWCRALRERGLLLALIIICWHLIEGVCFPLWHEAAPLELPSRTFDNPAVRRYNRIDPRMGTAWQCVAHCHVSHVSFLSKFTQSALSWTGFVSWVGGDCAANPISSGRSRSGKLQITQYNISAHTVESR